jgi:hypothetical protein
LLSLVVVLAVFYGIFTVSEADGLVDYPGGHALSGASVDCAPGGRQGLTSTILAVIAVAVRCANVVANEFIR